MLIWLVAAAVFLNSSCNSQQHPVKSPSKHRDLRKTLKPRLIYLMYYVVFVLSGLL